MSLMDTSLSTGLGPRIGPVGGGMCLGQPASMTKSGLLCLGASESVGGSIQWGTVYFCSGSSYVLPKFAKMSHLPILPDLIASKSRRQAALCLAVIIGLAPALSHRNMCIQLSMQGSPLSLNPSGQCSSTVEGSLACNHRSQGGDPVSISGGPALQYKVARHRSGCTTDRPGSERIAALH